MRLTKEQAEALLNYQKNPKLFFEDVLGINTLEIYQQNILKAIAENDRVAIKSCHDLGKSFTLARVPLWFMSCFPQCKVITTAPTFNLVKNVFWSELRSGYAKAKYPLGGKMNMTEWQMTPQGDWFAIGFTPRNEVSGEVGQGTQSSFQGFHAPYLMVIFDEATGIPKNIWTMCEGMLTSSNVKFIAIGNPTSRSGEFYKCFSSPEWYKISLTCFDSPNLKLNGINNKDDLFKEIDYVRTLSDDDARKRMQSYKTQKDYLLSLKWCVSMGQPRKWGIEHPLFVSKVLGEFPSDADGTLIPLGAVESAQLRFYFPTESDRKTMGVDVARFGTDATVLTALHGKKFIGKKKLLKRDVSEVSGEVIAFAKELGPFDVIVIDETGVGGGVVDLLNEAKRNNLIPNQTEIRGVQFGAACPDDETKNKFVNLKARMFQYLADDVKSSDGLCLPLDDDSYTDELPTIMYRYDSKGRMAIESKEDYKKRTGRKSPDDSDSLALANYGRYDEMTVGSFPDTPSNGYGTPFAAGLFSRKTW